jgi:tRNA pseudouridine38-40 synthase
LREVPDYKLTLAYDGTSFVGWQRQARGDSVQGLLEAALGILDQAPVTVAGSGRTDAGVHALGQVASVRLERGFEPGTLLRAVNAHLPQTIRILRVEEVPSAFHARFSARAKTYRYRIWNGPIASPFERAYVWHVPSPALDAEAMAAAAALLEGEHDFSAFQGTGAPTGSAVRRLFSSRIETSPITGHDGALITYEVCGSGFLRHMVRNVVGTLVEIGRGRRAAPAMREILASKARAEAGPTAPAAGLFLVQVFYETPDL